tara:strand:+ start:455 stop:727 length:273 start_codon:yes stop_codon:yes gene_type:complete
MKIDDNARFVLRILMFCLSFFLILDLIERYDGVDTQTGILALSMGLAAIVGIFLFIFSQGRKTKLASGSSQEFTTGEAFTLPSMMMGDGD